MQNMPFLRLLLLLRPVRHSWTPRTHRRRGSKARIALPCRPSWGLPKPLFKRARTGKFPVKSRNIDRQPRHSLCDRQPRHSLGCGSDGGFKSGWHEPEFFVDAADCSRRVLVEKLGARFDHLRTHVALRDPPRRLQHALTPRIRHNLGSTFLYLRHSGPLGGFTAHLVFCTKVIRHFAGRGSPEGAERRFEVPRKPRVRNP